MLSLIVFQYNHGHPKRTFTHYEPVQLVVYVDDEDQHIVTDHIYNPMFEVMGFDGKLEYANSYPGMMWFVSSLDKDASNLYRLAYDYCFPKIYLSYMKSSEEAPYQYKDFFINLEATVNNFVATIKNVSSDESLFSTVTIDEAKGHFVFKGEDPQDMWYCSDWKG